MRLRSVSPNVAAARKVRNIHERGFTFIELLIALGIGVLLLGAVGYSVAQVFNVNSRNTNHMTAVREVESAGYWLSHDALQVPYDIGNVTSPPPSPPWVWPVSKTGPVTSTSLKLYWRDSDNTSLIHYSTISWDSANKVITRRYDSGAQAQVAKYISSATFTVSLDQTNKYVSNISLVVQATVGTGNNKGVETRTYQVSPRAGNLP